MLDACAVIAAQQREAGGERLLSLLAQRETRALIHAITMCEIYYDLLRRNPQAELELLLNELAHWGVAIEQEISSLCCAGRVRSRRCGGGFRWPTASPWRWRSSAAANS